MFVKSIVPTTTENIANMTRKRKLRRKLVRAKGITSAPDRVDERLLDSLLQLIAQAVDVHFDHVGRAFPVRFPKAFAQHLARDNEPIVAHEHFENAELGRRQI